MKNIKNAEAPEASPTKRRKIDERRDAIIQAASDLFNERGFEGTSLNAILKKAGGSKRNFYTEFGGKEGLFKALIAQNIERLTEEQAEDLKKYTDLRSILRSIARRQIEVFKEPKLLGLYRIAVRDGLQFPEVAKAFFQDGPEKAVEHLSATLEKFAAKQELAPCDTRLCAYHFISMLHGRLFYDLFFDVRTDPGEAEIETYIASVVDLFLYGIRKRDDGKQAGAASTE